MRLFYICIDFSYNAPYDGMQLVLVFDTNNGSVRAEVIIVVLVRRLK